MHEAVATPTMARVDTPSFSLWPPIGAERLSRRAARQARTGQLRQRQPHSPQNNPVTAKCVCRCTSKNAGVARIDGRGGYFLVCVLRSPRAFVTDTVTDRLPDKMALMCVRSRPCRLANAVWLPSHSTATFRSRITSSSSNISARRPDTFSGMCFPSPYDMPLLA